MKMTKTFREKSKQKVLVGKSAGEQTGPCLFVLANKGENFQGKREESKEDMNRHPVHTAHTQTHTQHSGGFSDVLCSRTNRFSSAGSLCHPEFIEQAVGRRHFSVMTMLMIKDFLVDFSFPDKLVLS